MTGILFSLFPLVFWGISDYISSKMSKALHPAAINLFFGFTIAIPAIAFCSLFGFPELSLFSLLKYMFASVLLTGGYVFMLQAFKSGLTGIIAPIANAYAVVTLFVAVVFLGEETGLAQVLSVLVVVTGIFALSFEKDTENSKLKINRSIMFALLGMVLFGLGFAAFEVVAKDAWYENAIQFQIAGLVVAIIVALLWMKQTTITEITKAIKLKVAYLGAVAVSAGTIGLFIALENIDNVAVPATVASASPLVTVALTRHFDNERLNLRQYLAAIVVVVGVISLGLVS